MKDISISKELKRHRNLLVKLRDRKKCSSISLVKPCNVSFSDELSHRSGKTIKEVQIIFAASGCTKALSNDGPCSMCGFVNESNFGKSVSSDDLIRQFNLAIKTAGFKKSSIVTLFNSGSIYSELEFPSAARNYIFKKLNSMAHVEEVIIESRPEFATEEVLKETREILKDKKIDLAFGLEAATDIVRQQFINKGFSKKDFKRAMITAKKYDIDAYCYVLLKPPFLTEKESIKEVIKTVRYCFKNNVSGVTLMPCGVQTNTLTEFLQKNKEYRPAWLWSVVEVVRKAAKYGYVRIGTSDDNVIHLNSPHNCTECNNSFSKAFEQYNKQHDISVFEELKCECENDWKKDLAVVNPIPFNKRIGHFLKKYNV